MTFTQHVETCTGDHGPCTVIWCESDEDLRHEDGTLAHRAGSVLWRSHMQADVHPEHRVNPDHRAFDHRGDTPVPLARSEPCEACRPHFPGGA